MEDVMAQSCYSPPPFSDSSRSSHPSDLEGEYELIQNKENQDDNEEEADQREEDDQMVEEIQLDSEALKIFSDLPFQECDDEIKLKKDLITRWKFWVQKGIKKEDRDKFKLKYKFKGDCPLVAPKVNPEILATLSEKVKNENR